MKLLIIDGCIGKGGKVLERGQFYDTGDVNPKEDREAYDLITAGRALAQTDKDVPAVQAQIKKEIEQKELTKAEQKKADAAARK